MTQAPATVPTAGYTPDRVEDLIAEGRRLRALTNQRVTEIESTSGDPSGLSYHCTNMGMKLRSCEKGCAKVYLVLSF